jgi:hypothetical protein
MQLPGCNRPPSPPRRLLQLALHSMSGNHDAAAFYSAHHFRRLAAVPAFYHLRPSTDAPADGIGMLPGASVEAPAAPTLDAALMLRSMAVEAAADHRSATGTAAAMADAAASATASMMDRFDAEGQPVEGAEARTSGVRWGTKTGQRTPLHAKHRAVYLLAQRCCSALAAEYCEVLGATACQPVGSYTSPASLAP